MIKNLPSIVQALKDIQGFRFYFIVFLIFIGSLAYMFKDTITVNVRNITTKQVEFREVRNFGGLENSLNSLFNADEQLGYAVYMYQPREKSFQKRILISNFDLIKSINKLQSMYLEEQPSINDRLKHFDYVLLTHEEPYPDIQYLHDIGLKYIFVHRIIDRVGIIGEIQFFFIDKPSDDTLKEISTKLKSTIFLNVI